MVSREAKPSADPTRENAVEAWLRAILSRIDAGTLLPKDYFRELDCDAALDARDSDTAFGADWVKQSETVDAKWADAVIPDEQKQLAEDIRRESFLAVSRATDQHEIASYVSDDFDLIVRGKLLKGWSKFLDQLWSVYDRGEFPTPPLSS